MIGLIVLALTAAAAPTDCGRDALRRDIAACDSAIAAERDAAAKAKLLYELGYAWNERRRPDKAVETLDAALKLAPADPDSLHERAYALGELGQFEAALRDLDREAAIRPEDSRVYRERTFAHLASGDLEAAYRDSVRVAELEPQDPDAHLLQADRALWLGRFDEATRETERAEALAQSAKDGDALKRVQNQRSVIALWRTRSGAASPEERCRKAFDTAAVTEASVIGDCTAAFFAAPTNAKKAEYLTYRSVAWSAGQQDEGRWLADAEVATALEPSNPDWLLNVAAIYDRLGRPAAALSRIDRALAMKQSYAGFATRAAARYDSGDRTGAFEDASKSFNMHPNSVALWVLGDLARDRGDKPSAKVYWMAAWHLGSRDDGLRARLKTVGVDDPDHEPAK